MSDTTTSAGANRTVTAFFDTSEHANQAKSDLIAAGLPADGITIVGSDAEQFTVTDDHQQGFWESLTNFFMPEDDRRTYAEGLRRGGFALSVRTSADLYDQAIDVLDRDGAVDLDEREIAWESEGWSRSRGGVDNVADDMSTYRPADASTAGFGGSFAGEDGIARVDEATNPDVRERIAAGTADFTAATPTGGAQTYTRPAAPATEAGTLAAEDGIARVSEALNPDVRERIGAGTSDFAAPTPTGGPQTYAAPATPATDATGVVRPDADNLFGRRDLTHGRNRVRSYIVEDDR